MICQGYIKEVGQTIDWTDKNGEKKQRVQLVMRIPCGAREGKEYSDEMIGDVYPRNPEFLESLKRTCEAGEKCEFQVRFSKVDWYEKKIQNITVSKITKLLA